MISGADKTAALAAATRRAAQTVSLYMIESVCRQSVYISVRQDTEALYTLSANFMYGLQYM